SMLTPQDKLRGIRDNAGIGNTVHEAADARRFNCQRNCTLGHVRFKLSATPPYSADFYGMLTMSEGFEQAGLRLSCWVSTLFTLSFRCRLLVSVPHALPAMHGYQCR